MESLEGLEGLMRDEDLRKRIAASYERVASWRPTHEDVFRALVVPLPAQKPASLQRGVPPGETDGNP
jgi:hypothetical protein